MTDGVEAAKHGQLPSTGSAGLRRQTWLACSLALATSLLPAAAQAATPVATANFHTIGLYWYRTPNPAGVEIQYRPAGSTVWKGAQSLWFDSLSRLDKYHNQYRGSI